MQTDGKIGRISAAGHISSTAGIHRNAEREGVRTARTFMDMRRSAPSTYCCCRRQRSWVTKASSAPRNPLPMVLGKLEEKVSPATIGLQETIGFQAGSKCLIESVVVR